MLRQTKDRCIVDLVYWETAILGTLYLPKTTGGGLKVSFGQGIDCHSPENENWEALDYILTLHFQNT